jgi:predicted RNA-binding protein with PIN domain
MKRNPWPTDVRRHRWIVDGHNAIFAHPVLEQLQTGDQKGEARRRLEEMLERFAAVHGIEVLIVYDGNRMESNPDARRRGRVETIYSLAPDEEADDRIVMMSARLVHEGRSVVVVTSDRATLGARLPGSVVRVEPAELFRRIAGSPEAERSRDLRPAGDFSDIEAHFLALDAEATPSSRPPRRKPGAERIVPRPARPALQRPAPPVKGPQAPAPPPSPAGDARREAKRARGERAQQRRIENLQGKSGKRTRRKAGR